MKKSTKWLLGLGLGAGALLLLTRDRGSSELSQTLDSMCPPDPTDPRALTRAISRYLGELIAAEEFMDAQRMSRALIGTHPEAKELQREGRFFRERLSQARTSVLKADRQAREPYEPNYRRFVRWWNTIKAENQLLYALEGAESFRKAGPPPNQMSQEQRKDLGTYAEILGQRFGVMERQLPGSYKEYEDRVLAFLEWAFGDVSRIEQYQAYRRGLIRAEGLINKSLKGSIAFGGAERFGEVDVCASEAAEQLVSELEGEREIALALLPERAKSHDPSYRDIVANNLRLALEAAEAMRSMMEQNPYGMREGSYFPWNEKECDDLTLTRSNQILESALERYKGSRERLAQTLISRAEKFEEWFSSGIDLQGEDLSSLQGVPDLQEAEWLQISGTQITDLSPLSCSVKLTSLRANDIPELSDLTPLESVKKLEVLAVNETHVEDLSPLRRLAMLRHLEIMDTRVSDLGPLEDLLRMKRLLAGDNPDIDSIEAMAIMSNLVHLDISDSYVEDIDVLSSKSKLLQLDLSNTGVSDADDVAAIESLQWLSLENTPITDLTPLYKLEDLHHVNVTGTSTSPEERQALWRHVRALVRSRLPTFENQEGPDESL